jgi:hypothetical protein
MYTCLGEPPELLAKERNDAIYQSPHWLLVLVSITSERDAGAIAMVFSWTLPPYCRLRHATIPSFSLTDWKCELNSRPKSQRFLRLTHGRPRH